MKVYKLKHKSTGLFYTPSKGYGNLSTKGKIYSTKPNIKWTSIIRIIIKTGTKDKLNEKQQKLIDYFNIKKIGTKDYYWIDEYFETKPEDWEIIEL